MEDEEVYEGGDMDPSAAGGMLAQLSQQYGALGERQAAMQQQVERSRAERLRMAEEKIRAARFGMPSSSEQLFALSAAMLAPKPYRGFAGTLSNLVPVLGDISTARRTSDEQREQALMKLRSGYEDSTLESEQARMKAEREGLVDLMKVYGPLAKPKGRKTGFNPVTGRLTDMDTGIPVVPPPPQVGEEREGYVYLGGDPASQTSWRKKVM